MLCWLTRRPGHICCFCSSAQSFALHKFTPMPGVHKSDHFRRKGCKNGDLAWCSRRLHSYFVLNRSLFKGKFDKKWKKFPNGNFYQEGVFQHDTVKSFFSNLLPESEKPESPGQYQYRSLSDKQLSNLIMQIPRRSLLAGQDGIRISLAGAQEKSALFYKVPNFYIPMHGTPSNIILKPAMAHFQSSRND